MQRNTSGGALDTSGATYLSEGLKERNKNTMFQEVSGHSVVVSNTICPHVGTVRPVLWRNVQSYLFNCPSFSKALQR